MDIDEQVIEEVKGHSCLFDISSDRYKHVQEKEQIWANIGKRLNMDGEICKKRWKSLRDTYRRVKRTKMLASGSAAPSSAKTWRYYEAMQFLENVQSSRRTTHNLPENEDNVDCPTAPLPSPGTLSPSPGAPSPSPLPPTLSPLPPTPSPRPSARNQRANELSEFFSKLVDSADRTASIFSQRSPAKVETPAEVHFSSLAKLVDGANMPDEYVQRALHSAHIAVFGVIHEWSMRNSKSN